MGCASIPDAPEPIVCVNVEERGYFRCRDTSNNERFNIPYIQAERYICTPPEDYAEILNYADDLLRALKQTKDNL